MTMHQPQAVPRVGMLCVRVARTELAPRSADP